MKQTGTWKKRISIWLSMAMLAGNMVPAASPAVYAEVPLAEEQTQTRETVHQHMDKGLYESIVIKGVNTAEVSYICPECAETVVKEVLLEEFLVDRRFEVNQKMSRLNGEGRANMIAFEVSAPQMIQNLVRCPLDNGCQISLYKVEGEAVIPVSASAHNVYEVAEEAAQYIVDATYCDAGTYYAVMNFDRAGYEAYTAVVSDDGQYCWQYGHDYYAKKMILNKEIQSCILCEELDGSFRMDPKPDEEIAIRTHLNRVEPVTVGGDIKYQDLIFEVSEETMVHLYSNIDWDPYAELYYLTKNDKVARIATDFMGDRRISFEGVLIPGKYCLRVHEYNDMYHSRADLLVFLLNDDFSKEDYCQNNGHAYQETNRIYMPDGKMDRVARQCAVCGVNDEIVAEHEHRFAWESESYEPETDLDHIYYRCACGTLLENTVEHIHRFVLEMISCDGDTLLLEDRCSYCGEERNIREEQHHLYSRSGNLITDSAGNLKLDGYFVCSDPGCHLGVRGVLDFEDVSSGFLSMDQTTEKTTFDNSDEFYMFKVDEWERVQLTVDEADCNPWVGLYKVEDGSVNLIYGNRYGANPAVYTFGYLDAGTYYLSLVHYGNDGAPHTSRLTLKEANCDKNGHSWTEWKRDYSYSDNQDIVVYRCSVCGEGENRKEPHEHAYGWSDWDRYYDANLNQDHTIRYCVCGDSIAEVTEHDHNLWNHQIIDSYDGDYVTWSKVCEGCGNISMSRTEEHHLRLEWGNLKIDSKDRLKVEGEVSCTDPDCGFRLFCESDYSYFVKENLSVNSFPEIAQKYENIAEFHTFELENDAHFSLIIEDFSKSYTLYKEGYGLLTEDVLAYTYFHDEANDRSYGRYTADLSAGNYVLFVKGGRNDNSFYRFGLIDDTYCDQYGHMYCDKGNYKICVCCNKGEGNSNSEYADFKIAKASSFNLNEVTDMYFRTEGLDEFYEFTLDQNTNVYMTPLDCESEPYGTCMYYELYLELADGRLLRIEEAAAWNNYRELPAGHYYLRTYLDDPDCTGKASFMISEESFCEQDKAFYKQTRTYKARRGMDQVSFRCQICSRGYNTWEEHVHQDLYLRTVRVNTGSAMIEDYYTCRSCKKDLPQPREDVRSLAVPAELNEDFMIETDRYDWKVLSFDVTEPDLYGFAGKIVPGMSRFIHNCYATVYRDEPDGTLTKIIGNTYMDAAMGFSFNTQLDEGHYYVVVRSSLNSDDSAFDSSWRQVKMHIAKGSEYCDKYGHSGPIQEVLNINPETNEVTVSRKCSACDELYVASETHPIAYATARLATGSAISGPMAEVSYYCEDCDLYASNIQPLADIAVETEINKKEIVSPIDKTIDLDRSSRFFRFTIDEEQTIVLYDNMYSRKPAQDTGLYRLDGARLVSVYRDKVTGADKYFMHCFKAVLMPGTYYYRVDSLYDQSYNLIIGNSDYCAEHGHYYGAYNVCMFCQEPYIYEEDLLALPENADAIELDQVYDYPADGRDVWMTFTLNSEQRVIAAGASDEMMDIEASLYREVNGKMHLESHNAKYALCRNAVYLAPGTYYLHYDVENMSDAEDPSVKAGVFTQNYCITHNHLYSLRRILRKPGLQYEYQYKCAVCTETYRETRSEHTHNWREKYQEITEDGKIVTSSDCRICGVEKIWSEQSLSETEAISLEMYKKNEVPFVMDQINLFTLDSEEYGWYDFTFIDDLYGCYLDVYREIDGGTSYRYINSVGTYDSHRVYLNSGRYYFLLINDKRLPETTQTECIIIAKEGESYCNRFGHEMNPEKEIYDFDPETGETVMSERCTICDKIILTTEQHVYKEFENNRRVYLGVGSGSAIGMHNLMVTSYTCEECGLVADKSMGFFADKKNEIPINKSDYYNIWDEESYVMIPFSVSDAGSYQIQLPQDCQYDLYIDRIGDGTGYIEEGRGYTGTEELSLVQAEYLILIDMTKVRFEQLEMGIFAKGLHLTKSYGTLTAVYYGSEEPVNQGILVYPGELKGENLTEDTTPRTRIAFTQTEDRSFSLDISDMHMNAIFRAYVEFADGTIEYSNVQ